MRGKGGEKWWYYDIEDQSIIICLQSLISSFLFLEKQILKEKLERGAQGSRFSVHMCFVFLLVLISIWMIIDLAFVLILFLPSVSLFITLYNR